MADYVISTSGEPIVTVTEARRHLNISTTYDDAWLVSSIGAATRMVEEMTGRAYIAHSRRLTMRTFGDGRYVRGRKIYPQRTPIRSSSGVTISYIDSLGVTTTLPTSDYAVSAQDNPSCIAESYNATWPVTRTVDNDVTIDYVAGVSSVPPTVKLAVNMLVAHWYANREAGNDKHTRDVAYGVQALLAPEAVEYYG